MFDCLSGIEGRAFVRPSLLLKNCHNSNDSTAKYPK